MPPRSVCARVLRRDEQPTTNGIRSLPHLSLMVVRCPKGSVRVQLAARSRSLHSLYDLTTEAVQMTTSSSDPRGLRLLWLLISLSAMALAGCKENAGAGAGGHPPPPQVSVAQVEIKPITQWDEYNGRIEAIESVELRPRVSGYIERVAYREGDEVKKGDVLFTIDARSYRAELARAQAQLTRARSEAGRSRSEAQRAKVLVEQQAISTEAWEQRRAADESAQAEVQAAQAAVETAQLNLEWTQVRSPINGRASRARFTAGNLVAAGDAASVLTTIVSQDKVYAYFEADEKAFATHAWRARVSAPANAAASCRSGSPWRTKRTFLTTGRWTFSTTRSIAAAARSPCAQCWTTRSASSRQASIPACAWSAAVNSRPC